MLPNLIINVERALTVQRVLEHYKIRPSRDGAGRWFCPLPRCRGDRHPHFVIDGSRAQDQYGQPIDFTHHVNKDVVVRHHWHCEHSRVEGYGALSLISAIMGFDADIYSLGREQLVKVLTEAVDICGLPATELTEENRNGWMLVFQPEQQWDIHLADGFTPEALAMLSLRGEGVKVQEATDWLHREFGLWQVEKYRTSGCYPANDHTEAAYKSYERRAHALFQILAFCYDAETGEPLTENPEKRTAPWVARIVMPSFRRRVGEDFDWRSDFWTAFCTDDHRQTVRDFRMKYNVYGDRVAMACSRLESAMDGRSANDVVTDLKTGEELRLKKEVEQIVDAKTGEELPKDPDTGKYKEPVDGKTKTKIVTVAKAPEEIKLQKCVLCKSPLDGVATWYWLNYPRLTLPTHHRHGQSYWHVAWLAHTDMLLNPFENARLSRVAEDTFELFGNDRAEISLANNNALRYNYLRLCILPTRMSEQDAVESAEQRRHVPHTPIDFFRYYRLTPDEEVRNMLVVGSTAGCKSLLLQKELNAASALKPFTPVPKKKRGAGEVDHSYELNLAAAWQMMANNGYCRSIKLGSHDTIGHCYRIDGHFVYELQPDSVMADMRKCLEDYAKDNCNGDPEEAEMMLNAMLRCKDLQYSRNITKLPLMAMPKSESYNAELDYFFFRNGALEITPTHIIFRSYDELPFLVYRAQVLPFDYVQPFYSNRSPIHIERNKEYVEKLRNYQQLQRTGDLTSSELFALKQELDDFGIVGQWDLAIRPTEEYDERIVVPATIRNDKEHNGWLCWWPILRLLRCFSNEHWGEEEAGRFTDADRRELNARIINMLYTIGRCLFRHKGKSQVMPYFLENTVSREGKAEGGSGKSTLVEMLFRFVRKVGHVDGKRIQSGDDVARHFANFKFHEEDLVHVEDFPKISIEPFFNYASGKFTIRPMYSDPIEIERDESPQVVFSSNYMVQTTDDSTLGRVQFAGMSHYFGRYIAVLNKPGRNFDTIWPDFTVKPEECDPVTRGQVIYTFAKCVQFCMICEAADTRPAVPGSHLLERLSRTEMGDSFYDWFTSFLEKEHIYNAPISINEIFADYRRYLDPSKARVEMVSRTRFYENLQKFCAKPAHGVVFMPIKPFLTTSEQNRSRKKAEDGSEKSYLRKGASWFTRAFMDADGRVHHARVLSKNAGENCVTGGAVWFSKRGQEPKDADEFQRMLDAFMAAPDPEPILDENEQPITSETYLQWTMLNTEEDAETIRKAGGSRRMAFPTPNSSAFCEAKALTPNSDGSPATPPQPVQPSSFSGEAPIEGSLPF